MCEPSKSRVRPAKGKVAIPAQERKPSTVPGRMQGTTTVLVKPQRTAARRKASAAGEGGRTHVTWEHERWDIPCCCNKVYCGTSVEVASVYSRTGCGEKPL